MKKDLAKTLQIGLRINFILFAVFGMCGFLSTGFDINSGLNAARSGMLVSGALGLFLLAGSNLYKGGLYRYVNEEQWKKYFCFFSCKVVLGIISTEILALASVLDYFMYLVVFKIS